MTIINLIGKSQKKHLTRSALIIFLFLNMIGCKHNNEITHLLTNGKSKYWYYSNDSRGYYDNTPSSFIYFNIDNQYKQGERDEKIDKVIDVGSWQLVDSLLEFVVPYKFNDTAVYNFKILSLTNDSLLMEKVDNKVQVLYVTISKDL